MPRVEAARELLAAREDVWAFIAEPHHLPDWWPGLAGVEPDRRGLAPGARWTIHGDDRPRLLRRPRTTGVLLVGDVVPPERVDWRFIHARLGVELRLDATAPDRTLARLTVTAPWLIGLSRSLPRSALNRLYALCQTSASDLEFGN